MFVFVRGEGAIYVYIGLFVCIEVLVCGGRIRCTFVYVCIGVCVGIWVYAVIESGGVGMCLIVYVRMCVRIVA